MKTRQQKIRIGLFSLVTGALLGAVLIVFAGLRFWHDKTNYFIFFDDTVYGLEKGADVHVNGVRVGTVTSISIPSDPHIVQVTIEVDADAPVRADAHAVLEYTGLTGLKDIDLRGGTLKAPPVPEGGVIPTGDTLLDKLEDRTVALVDQSAQLMERANRVADATDHLVANLTALTEHDQLGELVSQTRIAAANLARLTTSLRGMIDENRASLRASLASIEETARRTAEAVDTGEVRAAVSDLRQASRSFKELAREVRQKPSRLFFSTPPPDRKLP